MYISEMIVQLHKQLPPHVRLVAVSKFHPPESILQAYHAGQRVFGESKVQEMTQKYELLPKDIEWHFIGHLQSNKIKYIAPYVSLIHGIDSFKLLKEVDKYAERSGRKIACLLQIFIATEESKFGFSFEECREMLQRGEWRDLKHITLAGVMGMASHTDSEEQVEKEFFTLRDFFVELKSNWFAQDDSFREISMGMSDDYPVAIQAGSTLVRIGSMIFGNRS
ncbi:MAG: YggS family pyridoxal phosphate-dependent enzyme [Phocaeicola sp.]